MLIVKNPQILYMDQPLNMACKVCGTSENVVACQDEISKKWQIACAKCQRAYGELSVSLLDVALDWLARNGHLDDAIKLRVEFGAKMFAVFLARERGGQQ